MTTREMCVIGFVIYLHATLARVLNSHYWSTHHHLILSPIEISLGALSRTVRDTTAVDFPEQQEVRSAIEERIRGSGRVVRRDGEGAGVRLLRPGRCPPLEEMSGTCHSIA